jgi:hypothetical protein
MFRSGRGSCAGVTLLVMLGGFVVPPVARAADRDGPFIDVGGALGAGWASVPGAERQASGGAADVFFGHSWTGPLSWAIDAHVWWHSQDTTRTELSVAGPALAWRPHPSGPLVRLTAGLAYEHQILEFAQTSEDLRTDGFGLSAMAAYEFRVAKSVAIGPQLEFNQLWLGAGASTCYWAAVAEVTFYIPSQR